MPNWRTKDPGLLEFQTQLSVDCFRIHQQPPRTGRTGTAPNRRRLKDASQQDTPRLTHALSLDGNGFIVASDCHFQFRLPIKVKNRC